MFKRSFPPKASNATKDRVNKIRKPSKRSFRDDAKQKLREQLLRDSEPPSAGYNPFLDEPIFKIAVGEERRTFSAHQRVMRKCPYFARILDGQRSPSMEIKVDLINEDPETFSAILEYLYKGDYFPRLLHDKDRNSWILEEDEPPTPLFQGGRRSAASVTIYHQETGEYILRDTAVYCSAGKYGLDELKRLALRKQGLVSGVDVATILRSARFTYTRTPESDARMRAHYLALIVRCRRSFKRSGTMQMEMEKGGKLFFDLFVAMCNHLEDVSECGSAKSTPTLH